MDTAIVVFTRDLRLHDNPALHQACARARQVVPLFVVDPAIAAPPNRVYQVWVISPSGARSAGLLARTPCWPPRSGPETGS